MPFVASGTGKMATMEQHLDTTSPVLVDVPGNMGLDTAGKLLVRQNAISPGNGTAMIFLGIDDGAGLINKRHLSSFVGMVTGSALLSSDELDIDGADESPCSAPCEVAGVDADSADPSIITHDPVLCGLVRISHGDSMVMDASTLAALRCELSACDSVDDAFGATGSDLGRARYGRAADMDNEAQVGGLAEQGPHYATFQEASAATASSLSLLSDVTGCTDVHRLVDSANAQAERTLDATEAAHEGVVVRHISRLARYPRITQSSDSEADSMCVSSLDSEASVYAALTGTGAAAAGHEGGCTPLAAEDDSPKARVHPATVPSNGAMALKLTREHAHRMRVDLENEQPSKLWTARTEDPGIAAQGTGDPSSGTSSAASRRRSVFAVVASALSLRRPSKVAPIPSAAVLVPVVEEAPATSKEQKKRRPSLVQKLFTKPRRASAPSAAGTTVAALPKALPVRPRAASMPQGIAVSLRSTAPSKWATVPTTPVPSASPDDESVQGERAALAALPRYSPQNPFTGLASLVRTASSAASFYRSIRVAKAQQAAMGQTTPT